MDLRDARDLSRDTMLAELDILEADEAVKVQRENEFYNEIFQAEQIEAEERKGEGSPGDVTVGVVLKLVNGSVAPVGRI